MAVFPESMNKLNADDVPGSLSIIQDYVRYMGERLEFSFRNMTRTVSAAGVSSAELYILVQAQAQTLAALQSVVNGITGNITALQTTTASHELTIQNIETQLEGIQGRLSALEENYTSLEQRVEALEHPPEE